MSALFLFACSSPDDTPVHEASIPETYSVEKQQYVQSCIETSDENFCSCQFDVMDPILSSVVGSDWSTKNMEEKDFETYLAAVESAVSQCS